MYKATRMLIEARQEHTNYKLQKVNVLSVPIGEANKCHHNTFEYQMNDVLKTGCTRSVPVSGWLVGKYNKFKDETEIIQHWWNIDEVTKQHFDTTPKDTERADLTPIRPQPPLPNQQDDREKR